MKHLVTRNDKSLEALKSLVMAGVKPYVVSEKARVTVCARAIVSCDTGSARTQGTRAAHHIDGIAQIPRAIRCVGVACCAMRHRTTHDTNAGGEAMIDFVVVNAAITDVECAAYQTPKKGRNTRTVRV
jgi:hypothetical protein